MDEFDRFFARVDPGGALEETRVRAEQPSSRRRFLLAGGGGLAAFLTVRVGDARAVSQHDVDILNYALTLEYLQSSFYTEAERGGALRGNTARAARVVGAVERAHVAAFLKLLGKQAVKRPPFNFQGVTEDQRAFLKTAVAFEDLAVAAYKGQAPRLQSKQVLAAAVGIHSVEARHAAWMRELFGITPSVRAFDRAATRPQIERLVASTHFIAAAPRMRSKQQPKFTG
jgi:rubrerythrin